MTSHQQQVRILEIQLVDEVLGYLAGYSDSRNMFTFAHDYIQTDDAVRHTFSLKYYGQTADGFRKNLTSRYKLHPIFSNLLPEGELREFVVRTLKIHDDHEFVMLAALGRDLPGALTVRELTADEVPPYALVGRPKIASEIVAPDREAGKFSLSGVLMKFSMVEKKGRFYLSKSNDIGSWIVKVPSTRFAHIPANEYTSMQLAAAAGIDIPEVRLVDLGQVPGIPEIKMPDEPYVYAIKRFDRDRKKRIHAEDFAQAFEVYPHAKYQTTNYDTLARTIYQLFPKAVLDIQEFMARLVVHIMIGNGDAHLKNWSILYPDRLHPTLAPAYDILYTRAYIPQEDSIALNLGKEKRTAALSLTHFKTLARRADVDWQVIKGRIQTTIDQARTEWPKRLKELPMETSHKRRLRNYWKSLMPDFRIEV